MTGIRLDPDDKAALGDIDWESPLTEEPARDVLSTQHKAELWDHFQLTAKRAGFSGIKDLLETCLRLRGDRINREESEK